VSLRQTGSGNMFGNEHSARKIHCAPSVTSCNVDCHSHSSALCLIIMIDDPDTRALPWIAIRNDRKWIGFARGLDEKLAAACVALSFKRAFARFQCVCGKTGATRRLKFPVSGEL